MNNPKIIKQFVIVTIIATHCIPTVIAIPKRHDVTLHHTKKRVGDPLLPVLRKTGSYPPFD